jgi:hypothetical protein
VGFFQDAKDRFLERMAVPLLNRTLVAPYGKVRELRLDTAEKSATAVLELEGEREPVHVAIDRYEVSKRGGERYVTIHAIRTSRPWMTELARRQLVGRTLPLPPELGGLVMRLI